MSTTDDSGGKYHFEELFSNGLFISDYIKDFNCKGCSLKDMKFIGKDDYIYFFSLENKVFGTKDGGMTWVEVNHIRTWHEMCYIAGDDFNFNDRFKGIITHQIYTPN